MSIFGQKDGSAGPFGGGGTGSGDAGPFGTQGVGGMHPGVPGQMAPGSLGDAEKLQQTSPAGEKGVLSGEVLRDIPVSIRQKSFGELLSSLKKQLEEDVREFRRKALETFAYDEKIIKARNNYARILQMVKAETRKLEELEENVDFFLQYIRDMEKPAEEGASAVNVIREVEKLSDEFNSTLQQVRDEDDEVMALVNENMSLIRMIDEKLGGEIR